MQLDWLSCISQWEGCDRLNAVYRLQQHFLCFLFVPFPCHDCAHSAYLQLVRMPCFQQNVPATCKCNRKQHGEEDKLEEKYVYIYINSVIDEEIWCTLYIYICIYICDSYSNSCTSRVWFVRWPNRPRATSGPAALRYYCKGALRTHSAWQAPLWGLWDGLVMCRVCLRVRQC